MSARRQEDCRPMEVQLELLRYKINLALQSSSSFHSCMQHHACSSSTSRSTLTKQPEFSLGVVISCTICSLYSIYMTDSLLKLVSKVKQRRGKKESIQTHPPRAPVLKKNAASLIFIKVVEDSEISPYRIVFNAIDASNKTYLIFHKHSTTSQELHSLLHLRRQH
jgi:hypothetical protein